MTCRELITILQQYHPNENVTLFSASHRNMQILGENHGLTQEYGNLVLDVDWSIEDKPVESVKDQLIRQRDNLTQQICKMSEQERKTLKRSIHKKTYKKRTTAEIIASGCIPTGKKGRPRKIRSEEELNEMYNKNQTNDELTK